MMLQTETIMNAARDLLECAILDLADDADGGTTFSEELASAGEVVARVLGENAVEVAAVVGRLVGRIEQAWGHEAGLVFYHMGLTGDQQADALYRVLMSCMGHGIGIEDHWSEEFDNAGRILRNIGEDKGARLDGCPMHFDGGSDLEPLFYEYLVFEE